MRCASKLNDASVNAFPPVRSYLFKYIIIGDTGALYTTHLSLRKHCMHSYP